jgi:hypothetical protein
MAMQPKAAIHTIEFLFTVAPIAFFKRIQNQNRHTVLPALVCCQWGGISEQKTG